MIFSFYSADRVDSFGTIVIVCVFWTLQIGDFLDGLRGGQKDDEEVFSQTCQNSGVFYNRATLRVTRSDRPGPAPENLPTLVLDHLNIQGRCAYV